MITNNVDFLQRVILSMADEAYKNEVIDTHMEDAIVGPGLDWQTKEEWISDFIVQHFDLVKTSIIDKHGTASKDQIVTHQNTIAMRMYALDVGESFDMDNFNRITRFPGGWGLRSSLHNTMTFIPFDSEFNVHGGILAKEFERIIEEDMEEINERIRPSI